MRFEENGLDEPHQHGVSDRVIIASDGVANVGLTDPDSLLGRIDGAYARTVQAIAQLPAGADLQSAGLDPNADQARRAAIADVLGPEATHAFTFAERKAERRERLRGQFRADQVRGR